MKNKKKNKNKKKKLECFDYNEVTKDMVRYDEKLCGNQKWVNINEIIVASEWDKEQLLKAFKYLHNNFTIDTDFMAVNSLVHFYLCPEKIKVLGS